MSTTHSAVAMLTAATSCGAWANDPTPYYVGASQGFTHDSNVFRTPGGPGDNYSSTSVLGGFDQMLGRQRVFATANIDLNRFQDQQQLDNTSYGANAGWDWATIEKLSGNAYMRLNQTLASLNDNTLRPSTGRNLVKNRQFGAHANWGGAAALNLRGGYDHSSVSYSAPAYSNAESSQNSVDFGGSYRLGATLTVGSALRYSQSVADQALTLSDGTFLSNTTNSRNLDLSAVWEPGTLTRMNARASWTRQTNSGVSSRNYSGLTGSLDFSYLPTTKLSFTGSLSRDAGTNSTSISAITPLSNVPIVGRSENSQISNNLSLGATYAATSKISVNAAFRYRRSNVVDALNIGTTSSTSEYGDTSHNMSLGASYAVARNWLLTCNVARTERNVGGTVPFQYSANTANCSARYTLR